VFFFSFFFGKRRKKKVKQQKKMQRAIVLLFALVACAATKVNAFSLAEINFVQNLYPGGDCDSAAFALTRNCTQTPNYWATHNSKETVPENDIVWPGLVASASPNFLLSCPDVFIGGPLNYSTVLNYRMIELGYLLYDGITLATPNFRRFFSDGTQFGGVTPLQVMKSTETSICYVYGRQYISVNLNLCSGTCFGYGGINSTLFDSMQLMATFLFGTDCQTNATGNYDPSNDLMAAYNVLVGYNNGEQEYTSSGCELKYGPYHCEARVDDTPCRAPPVDCPTDTCVGECTRSQNYWNKNSLNAKSNDTSMGQWASVCDLEWIDAQQNINCPGTVFVPGVCNATLEKTPYAPWIPALTWRGVLRTAANKDACLIAAKRIITAELNINCGGSCTTETLESVIAEAKAIMLVECADIVGTGAKGAGPYINGLNDTTASNSTSGGNRRRLLSLASYIANYNNGFGVGPGYCDEDITSAITVEEVAAECDSGEKNVINSTDQKVQFVFVIITFCIAVIILAWKIIVVLVKWCRGMPENTPIEESMYRLGRAFETTAAAKFQQPSNPNLRNRYGH
jgi:hypothetical protein